MLKKIKLHFIKKKNGVTNEDKLSQAELLEMKWLTGHHPKIKWVDPYEKELNRRKFIKYHLIIQSKKFNL